MDERPDSGERVPIHDGRENALGARSTGAEMDRRLRDAGGAFIVAHREASQAIAAAAQAEVPAEAIARASGLSLETVRIFLRDAGS